ncbi:SulP family inorganic anion transporter [Cupriavidus basilensis]|uniref:SulP family inorganic anion transporter n=1 Tax=Cupriavidus basilensis TaxID=68895 RepID=UPI00157B0AD4|nr:SulP family inorganic anion transporter [Cupriavidus basilensis]NUA28641.1 SulP family inorganic anion transporter [Cupriavidus basilensis]
MNQESPISAHGLFHLAVPEWLRVYQKAWIKPDIIAGLTAGAVVIPKALAYATVAGLPIEVGLYTAFLPMVIYAVLGTSRPLSVSTTATLAILGAAALGRVAPDADPASLMIASATLTMLVGGILVLASLLRLGFVANFISDPVLTGFKAGIAIIIVLDQIPKLLGIHFAKGAFLHNLLAIAAGLPHTSVATLAVGAATIGMLLALEHFAPRAPAPLIAIAAGIAGVSLLGLPAQGVETVGHVPAGLPTLTMPDMSLLADLWPPAIGIALMSFTETIAAGRAFAKSGEPLPAANRELLAIGMANIGGALLGAMPAGGGTSQTAVNRLAGACSQLAAMVTAALALATMLLLGPFIAKMPHATLAAVVIVYSVGLIEPAEFRAILRVRRTEFVWALAAMVGVVLLGTLQGIVVAIVVSLVALAQQVSDPPVHVVRRKPGTNVFRPVTAEHPEDEDFPGLLMLRPEGRIFFANAQRLAQKIRPLVAEARPSVVALDLSAVFDLEYTALKMLTEAEKTTHESGWKLWLVGLNPGVLALVQRSPLGETLGRERMFLDLEHAVARYQRGIRDA